MNNRASSLESEKLQAAVNFFSGSVAALKSALQQVQSEIAPTAAPTLNDSYHQRVLAAFEQSRLDCGAFEREQGEDRSFLSEVQKNFLAQTNDEFSQAWIGNRARTKPNGFVGDYEMLIKLYDEKTPATGLGGYLDLCISDLPLARAVRTRLKGAREFLIGEISRRKGTVRVLDVASGPCREYHDWPRFTEQQVEVVAMDTDPQALDYVQTNVCPNVTEGTTLKPVRYNALRTSVASATIRQFGKFDVIYSVGLCDYLTDEQLVRMFGAWKETLNEGGVMYVAFKDCQRYDHTPYQWHLDWYFYQRTREEAVQLFAQAGIPENEMEITRDETGIIINFIYRSPKASHQRIDGAETAMMPHLDSANISAGAHAEK
jgi:extracellular factor (EF) 3-hydroxypalmitic acid methyl ester biosynthesis protein